MNEPLTVDAFRDLVVTTVSDLGWRGTVVTTSHVDPHTVEVTQEMVFECGPHAHSVWIHFTITRTDLAKRIRCPRAWIDFVRAQRASAIIDLVGGLVEEGKSAFAEIDVSLPLPEREEVAS